MLAPKCVAIQKTVFLSMRRIMSPVPERRRTRSVSCSRGMRRILSLRRVISLLIGSRVVLSVRGRWPIPFRLEVDLWNNTRFDCLDPGINMILKSQLSV